MFSPNNDEDSDYADECRFTGPQQTATMLNDDTLTKAIARTFSGEAVKETFQREILKPISERVEKHDKQIAALASENYHLRPELEELKQYGHRNALRVFNPTWRENEDDSTDGLILTLCDEFALGIKREEISRSHRVGKPVPSKPRPILVKFVSYRSREKLYDARKSIAETHPYIRIYEDLTKTTNELAYKALECRRQGRIHHTWVYDGNVFVRTYERGRAVVIRDEYDLEQHALPSIDPLFSEITSDGSHANATNNPNWFAMPPECRLYPNQPATGKVNQSLDPFGRTGARPWQPFSDNRQYAPQHLLGSCPGPNKLPSKVTPAHEQDAPAPSFQTTPPPPHRHAVEPMATEPTVASDVGTGTTMPPSDGTTPALPSNKPHKTGLSSSGGTSQEVVAGSSSDTTAIDLAPTKSPKTLPNSLDTLCDIHLENLEVTCADGETDPKNNNGDGLFIPPTWM